MTDFIEIFYYVRLLLDRPKWRPSRRRCESLLWFRLQCNLCLSRQKQGKTRTLSKISVMIGNFRRSSSNFNEFAGRFRKSRKALQPSLGSFQIDTLWRIGFKFQLLRVLGAENVKHCLGLLECLRTLIFLLKVRGNIAIRPLNNLFKLFLVIKNSLKIV